MSLDDTPDLPLPPIKRRDRHFVIAFLIGFGIALIALIIFTLYTFGWKLLVILALTISAYKLKELSIVTNTEYRKRYDENVWGKD